MAHLRVRRPSSSNTRSTRPDPAEDIRARSSLRFFAQFGDRIPRSLLLWRELLLARLNGLPTT